MQLIRGKAIGGLICLITVVNMTYAQAVDTIFISYDQEAKRFFKEATTKALKQGVLTKDLKVKQPAVIQWNRLTFNAKIRLKGDWTDHIKKDRNSFRIELQEGNIYKVRKFSLQFPETRGGANEAIFHEILRAEGILTTNYRFVHLVVNEVYWGIFAFEEHFDELLIENNQRIQGPILKFDEEGFWECQYWAKISQKNKCYEYPIFEASRVKAFNQKKIRKDTAQIIHFLKARSILEQWQMGAVDFNSIAVEKFAKYYALCDLFQFYHGLQWHNQRFYYRKIDQKIEPVAYDCYSKDNHLIGKSFLGLFDEHYQTVYFKEQWFNYQLFLSEDFKEAYYYWLKVYQSKEWKLEENKIAAELKNRLAKRSVTIEAFIQQQQLSPKFFSYSQWKEEHPEEVRVYQEPKDKKAFPHVAIRARIDGKKVRLTNYDLNTLTVIGWGSKTRLVKAVTPQIIEPNQTIFIDANKKFFKLYYLGKNKDTLSSPIELPSLKLKSKVQDTVYQDGLLIENKNFTIQEHIIIPKGQTLTIKNATVDFNSGGSITAYGEVKILNSQLSSSDLTSNGIAVVYANLSVKNSKITQFNVHENNAPLQCTHGKVILEKLMMENIQSNDGVNLNNCDFLIKELTAKHISGDAVDIDYGQGAVMYSRFKDVGGDAIDLSGATVKIRNLKVQGCEDKGVSIGERSSVLIHSISIKKCTVGIAVKDESKLAVEAVKVAQCDKDVDCFIKKGYYNSSGTLELIGNKNRLNVQ
ncbi:MAG: CotH kinase family protein [Flavobacteriales bacterium]|nr:CotH kinase family protein [Flavobacteriales bacterium]